MLTLATGRDGRPDDRRRGELSTYPHFSASVHRLRFFRMCLVVAGMAKRYQVFRIIRPRRIVFQMLNMMHLRRLPLPAVPPAFLAHIFVAPQDPRPQSLPSQSLIKIIIIVVKCHSFLIAKRTMPPWSAASCIFLPISDYHGRFQKSRHLTASIAPGTYGRTPPVLPRASG